LAAQCNSLFRFVLFAPQLSATNAALFLARRKTVALSYFFSTQMTGIAYRRYTREALS
jgi:hypothetical protein